MPPLCSAPTRGFAASARDVNIHTYVPTPDVRGREKKERSFRRHELFRYAADNSGISFVAAAVRIIYFLDTVRTTVTGERRISSWQGSRVEPQERSSFSAIPPRRRLRP